MLYNDHQSGIIIPSVIYDSQVSIIEHAIQTVDIMSEQNYMKNKKLETLQVTGTR